MLPVEERLIYGQIIAIGRVDCLEMSLGKRFLQALDDSVLTRRTLPIPNIQRPLYAPTTFVSRLPTGKFAIQYAPAQRERIELSQTIHDTRAQSSILIGLGLETAIELADVKNDDRNDELIAKLSATRALSKSTIWELRHPIDISPIFEGRKLGNVLSSHVSTLTTITSIPTEFIQSGNEPELPIFAKRLLFSTAHNAMTNAFRHSGAGKVTNALNFEGDEFQLSVADDGIGLPANYGDRGHGFRNMRSDAKTMGGRLESSTGTNEQGTVVSCTIPYVGHRGGV